MVVVQYIPMISPISSFVLQTCLTSCLLDLGWFKHHRCCYKHSSNVLQRNPFHYITLFISSYQFNMFNPMKHQLTKIPSKIPIIPYHSRKKKYHKTPFQNHLNHINTIKNATNSPFFTILSYGLLGVPAGPMGVRQALWWLISWRLWTRWASMLSCCRS